MRTLLISVLVFGMLAGSAHGQTVGYRGNPTHDARVAGVPAPPLGVLWQTDLGSPMGYPVVAEGAVFVSVRNKTGTGTTIVSLDAATGAVRWSVPNPGVYWYGGLAYDAGRLYVVNHDGDLRALAPASGAVLWAVKLAQYSYDSPPVAYDGKVYIVGTGSGATLSVVDGASGGVLWTRNMPSGGGSPAVDSERIYVGMACRWMYAYSRASGDLLWQHQSDCSGGGDYTPAVSGGRVYAQGDNPAVYDAASGTQVATATFDGAYGIADGMAYVPLKGALLGVDAASWATRWTYGGTGVSSEAPLIGDTHVYVTADAGVLALDRATGAPAWCAGIVATTPSDDHHDSHMGAGDGRLFVPMGGFLVAYGRGGGAPKPCADGSIGPSAQGPLLSLGPDKEEIIAGRPVSLEGVLTGATAAEVEIQSDAWPFDGKWRPRAKVAIGADGKFAASLKPGRNTRYRALAAGVQSAEITVFADLGIRFRSRNRPGGRFRETVVLTGPRTPRLAAKRLHLYVIRAGSRIAVRAASPRLRRVGAGRYSATATLRYLRPRSKTIVIACYREKKADAWGPRRDLDRACGRARLRFTKPAAAAAVGSVSSHATASRGT